MFRGSAKRDDKRNISFKVPDGHVDRTVPFHEWLWLLYGSGEHECLAVRNADSGRDRSVSFLIESVHVPTWLNSCRDKRTNSSLGL